MDLKKIFSSWIRSVLTFFSFMGALMGLAIIISYFIIPEQITLGTIYRSLFYLTICSLFIGTTMYMMFKLTKNEHSIDKAETTPRQDRQWISRGLKIGIPMYLLTVVFLSIYFLPPSPNYLLYSIPNLIIPLVLAHRRQQFNSTQLNQNEKNR